MLHMFNSKALYPDFFGAYRSMYWDQYLSESIGECTVGQTDQQKLWLYLAAFRYQTTKQSYKTIR